MSSSSLRTSRGSAHRAVVALSAALLILPGWLAACGDSDGAAPSTSAPDAGEAVEAAAEAAPGPLDAAACDLASDLTQGIPDASIADGGSTSGICLACLRRECGSSVQACSASCECKDLAQKGLDCFAKNSANPTACYALFLGQQIPPSVQLVGAGLFQCVSKNCSADCATGAFITDAGRD